MYKNAMRLILTGLKSMQGPSRVWSSSLINGDTFPRMGESVRQFAILNTVNGQCKPTVTCAKEVPCTGLPPMAINGFGRIGKCVLRMALHEDVNVVAINQPGAKIEDIARSLKFDTVHGTFAGNVSVKGDNCLDIDGKTVRLYNEKDPEKIKWKELQVEYVIDSTGKFTEVEPAKKHLAAGVKKVIISAPSKDAPMFVRGVNFDKYKKDMTVVSNASCTTNCAAPLINIINQKYGVEQCLLTTVHAVTSSQQVHDGVKASSAISNIAHSTTGAAKAVGIVIPELKGKVTGDSIRVPVLDVSLLKLYINVKKSVKLEELMCPKLWECEVISYINDKLASSAFIGSYCSAIVDFRQISVMGNKFMTIGAWYDNEMGYAKRLLDLYNHMVKVDNKKPAC
ncbi:glyceraldehyde-3-phosphate dehydrogenase-like [Acyrthosiphon pisum]|uniref:Glyceraldehyde 3-phosphate dehydrogenase NAD(P) binding domain-containing protein n=1 Tax=Acyrthosiphon pisum TaxID=7029 RepID=A0A8R2A3B4_ACYPI|nr:glyceraldehyde-3-phosphate dehydrogenase-like [Acyrthosiphon pisum]|eukprot:XP_001943699.2 PREDICTED: glyceraldehyde-3-phosphate dehydrogenase-like [Acyrthosiphon pisum]